MMGVPSPRLTSTVNARETTAPGRLIAARTPGAGAPTTSRTGPSGRGGAKTVTRTGAPAALVATATPSALAPAAPAAGTTADTSGPVCWGAPAPTTGVGIATAG